MEIYFLGFFSISGSYLRYVMRTDSISYLSHKMTSIVWINFFSLSKSQLECFQVDFEVVFDIWDMQLQHFESEFMSIS